MELICVTSWLNSGAASLGKFSGEIVWLLITTELVMSIVRIGVCDTKQKKKRCGKDATIFEQHQIMSFFKEEIWRVTPV